MEAIAILMNRYEYVMFATPSVQRAPFPKFLPGESRGRSHHGQRPWTTQFCAATWMKCASHEARMLPPVSFCFLLLLSEVKETSSLG